jgi:hypothetical protein
VETSAVVFSGVETELLSFAPQEASAAHIIRGKMHL